MLCAGIVVDSDNTPLQKGKEALYLVGMVALFIDVFKFGVVNGDMGGIDLIHPVIEGRGVGH